MKGNKILYAGIAILILGIGFAVGTYAYYQTTVTGTVGGTVLAWQCTANGKSDNFTISLAGLYPGYSSTESISLASTIDATYTITFGTFEHMGSGSDHPNLNIYRDSGHQTALESGSTLQGSLTGGAAAITQNIYVYWPYGTTTEAYDSDAPRVTLTVSCQQI